MDQDSKRKILADSVMFRGLDGTILEQLTEIVQEKSFGRGEVIFLEGTVSSGCYLVAQGQVKLFKLAVDGREQILYILYPGEPFGIVPVFHGQTFPANAVCLTASTVFFFPKNELLKLISSHSALALTIMAALARRLRRFAAKIESLSLKEVPTRLAVHLLYLAETQGRTDQILLDIPKKQLANLLGTSAETLSRIFAELSAAGLIRVNGKQIELLQYEELRKRAWGQALAALPCAGFAQKGCRANRGSACSRLKS